VKTIELRPYQEDAISSWERASHVSVFEMATGTGKTITAISAAMRLSSGLQKELKSTVVLVVCPYLHLVDQWSEQFLRFGVNAFQACESSVSWRVGLEKILVSNALRKGGSVVVVATQATFMGDTFQKLLSSVSQEIILIADEVHNFGSTRASACLPRSVKYRLGLSATPDRWNDESGSRRIFDYFGGVSFKLDISSAIQMGFLTPYSYHPRVVPLNDDETLSYVELTTELAKVLGGRRFEDLDSAESRRAGAILRARAALIGDASGKQAALEKDLAIHLGLPGQLVYCSEGTKRDSSDAKQIDRIQALITKRKLGRSAIYDSIVPRETRQILLRNFVAGELTHLLSMRCLDEGVDIPSAKIAYLLASSTNPRQFVQRRGRVLRVAHGKSSAVIYDYFVLPKMSRDLATLEAGNRIVERELSRTMEFIGACTNKAEALAAIEVLRGAYNFNG